MDIAIARVYALYIDGFLTSKIKTALLDSKTVRNGGARDESGPSCTCVYAEQVRRPGASRMIVARSSEAL